MDADDLTYTLFSTMTRYCCLSQAVVVALCLAIRASGFTSKPSSALNVQRRRPAALRPLLFLPRLGHVQRRRQQQQRSLGRLPVSYEDLMEKLPSRSVVDAIAARHTERVVAADVAAAAGLSLSQARKELTALASITRGNIAVSADGDLIYSFPANLSAVLAQNSAKYRSLQTFRKVWPALFWVVRVSFGVTLLASLFAIFSAIIVLQSSTSDDDRRRDDRRGYGGGGGMTFGGGPFGGFWGPSPFDFFYYRPYGYYGYYGSAAGGGRRPPEEMGFFESVFSYIFGDGDPNAGLEARRLALAAELIRSNKGAVTAEQLAPFCDDAPDPRQKESATFVDENFVLPIVTALDGEPQVTDDGEIVYVFPELQSTAAKRKIVPAVSREAMVLRRAGIQPEAGAGEIKQIMNYNGINTRGALERADLVRILEKALPAMTLEEEAELLESDPNVLQEREWKFSLAPDINKVLAGGLGIVNLGGALYLGNLFAQYAAYGVQVPPGIAIVQNLYPLLLGYAILFNVIPLVRNFWISRQNAAIRQRNQVRRQWKTALAAAVSSGSLGKKLRAARKMGTKVKQLGSSSSKEDIVYDTSQSFEQTERQKQDQDLEAFDRRLQQTNTETNNDDEFQ